MTLPGIEPRSTGSLANTNHYANVPFWELILHEFEMGFRLGLVLWHINHCRLFNAKFGLFIYTICKHKLTKLN